MVIHSCPIKIFIVIPNSTFVFLLKHNQKLWFVSKSFLPLFWQFFMFKFSCELMADQKAAEIIIKTDQPR